LALKTKPQDMAMIEFTPDSSSDYAKEIFLPLGNNEYLYKNDKKSWSRNDYINDKVISYLNKLLDDSKVNDENDENVNNKMTIKINLYLIRNNINYALLPFIAAFTASTNRKRAFF
jgi:hypothetical protein